MSEIFHRPLLSDRFAINLGKKYFNLDIHVESCVDELDSYEDRNFLVCGTTNTPKGNGRVNFEANIPKRFVLKVMNARESYSGRCNIDAIDNAMIHMNNKLGTWYDFPMPQRSITGQLKESIELPVQVDKIPHNLLEKLKEFKTDQSVPINMQRSEITGRSKETSVLQVKYYLRLLSYVDGVPLSSMEVVTDDHMYECGKLAAKVSEALKEYSHPALMTRRCSWDMKNFTKLSEEGYLSRVDDLHLRERLEIFFKKFEEEVAPLEEKIPKQTLHSDISQQNVIVSSKHGENKISGLIDFGDLIHSYRVCEVANCMSHIGAVRRNEMKDCGIILSGYLSEAELTKEELHVLFYFVTGRIALCYLKGLFELSQACNVANDYVRNITDNSKSSLKKFLERLDDQEEIVQHWTTFC